MTFSVLFLPRSAPSGSEAVPAREPLTINLSSAAAQPPAAQQVPQVPSQVSWPSQDCMGYLHGNGGDPKMIFPFPEGKQQCVTQNLEVWSVLMKLYDELLGAIGTLYHSLETAVRFATFGPPPKKNLCENMGYVGEPVG